MSKEIINDEFVESERQSNLMDQPSSKHPAQLMFGIKGERGILGSSCNLS